MFSQIQKLFTHSVIYGIGYVFSRFLTFLLLPLYTNVLSQEQYGLITMGYLFLGIVKIFYTYGIDSAFLRYYEISDEDGDRTLYFSTAFWSVFGTSLLLSIAVIALHNPITLFLFEEPSYSVVVLLLGFILFADALNILPRTLLRIREQAVMYTLVVLLNVSVTLGLNIYLIAFRGMGVLGAFIANAFASLAMFLALSPLILRGVRFRFSSVHWQSLLKFGIPLVPAGLAATALELIDRLLLKELTDLATVGLYTSGYKLGIFMMLVVTAFYYAWQPFFMKEGQHDDGGDLFARIFTYFLFVLGGLFVLLTLFLREIINISLFGVDLLGEGFRSALPIVPIIFAAYMFYGAYVNFLPGVYLKAKSSRLAYFTGAGALVNIVGNLLLIPPFGIFGAAWSTLLGYATMAFLLYFTNQELYPTPYDWSAVAKTLVITTVLAGIYFLWHPGIWIKILLVLMYPTLHLIFGFIQPDELRRLADRLRRRAAG